MVCRPTTGLGQVQPTALFEVLLSSYWISDDIIKTVLGLDEDMLKSSRLRLQGDIMCKHYLVPIRNRLTWLGTSNLQRHTDPLKA